MTVHVEVDAELNRRKVQQTADEMAAKFDDINVAVAAHLNDAQARAEAAKLQRHFSDIHTEVKVGIDRSSMAYASSALNAIRRSSDDASMAIQGLGTAAMKTGRGLLTIAAPGAAMFLLDLAKVATTATQSIYLLPAAATAAAAGIGTLALATSGFADTVKEVRDPEKFAAAIQGLSPAAQQAALEIRNLLPELDNLKNATQDAFFAGFAEKLHELSATLLPGIQQMTTSIATSMNQALTGVADQLMTPENQAQLQTTFANIGQFFTNLTPMATSLSQAFLDITTTGSTFLPGLASDIAGAAANFAEFIRQAQESGQLEVWIQQGIDAVKALGQAAWDIGQIIWQVFGEDGQQNINDFKDTIEGTRQILALLSGDFSVVGNDINSEFGEMTGAAAAYRDYIATIPQAMLTIPQATAEMANAVIAVFNGLGNSVKDSKFLKVIGALSPAAASAMGAAAALPDIPALPVPNYDNIHPGTTPGQAVAPPGAGQRVGNALGTDMPRPGSPFGDPNRLGPYQRSQVPGPPPDKGGKQPSDKDRRDAIIAGLDPSLYKVADPFAAQPGLPDPYAAPPGAVQGVVDPQAVAEARQKVLGEAHDLEEDRKNRLALERDNTASAEDINDAKWKEVEDGWALQKAQADLADKMRGTAEKVKKGTDKLSTALSAGLDPDFGLGKGLVGFADNLVRFLGHAALAGPMAELQQTIDETEARTGIKGGYGFLGMRGASNLEQGLSPLLGNPLPAGTTQSGSTSTSPSFVNGALTNATTSSGTISMPPGTVMPSILEDTGSTPSGPQSRATAAALQQVFGNQIKGKIGGSRDENTAPGTHDAGLSIDIPIAADQRGPGGLGDQINAYLQQNAAALGLKYSIWHGKGTYPGGGGFTAGGHEDHVDAHFNGQGGTGGPLTAGYSGGSTASLPSGVVPVYVTNMGGGMGAGAPGGAPGGAPAGAPGAPGARPPMPTGGVGAGGPREVAQMVYQQAISRGYSPHDAQAIVAYAIGESSLDPKRSGGVQGDDEVLGLFQEKQAFARGGGIDPSQRTDPMANTWAYLNQLEKNRSMPIEKALPATSSGGPLASGPGAQPQAWQPLLQQAQNYLGGAGNAALAPAPGRSGFTPGVGYVDSAGNPTGYNPGGSAPATPTPGGATANNAPPLAPGPLPGPAPGNTAAPAAAFNPATGGAGPDTTKIGGLPAPDSINPGGTGFGIMPGGTIDSLIQGSLQAAGDAGGMFGGGAGGAAAAAAAQTLMKLANRAIQFGGEAAGIGVSGLMETFLPTGGSELAQNNWLTRIAGAVGAAAPALPNLAGGAQGQAQQQGPLTPEQVAANGGFAGASGFENAPNINITQNNNNGITNPEKAANAIADNTRVAAAAPMASR